MLSRENALKNRIALEKSIVRRIVKDALAKGYVVSLNDGEEWTVRQSSNYTEINKALFSVDEETLRFRDAKHGIAVGAVFLVYGNDGFDVICDYSANDLMEDLLTGANAIAEKAQLRA